jgi:sortase A
MLRFAASVMAVTGAMLVAIASVTLLWQEPVSALTASRAQDGLERDLAALEARPARSRNLRAAARRYGADLRPGEAFGRIAMPTLERRYALVQGTDAASLRKGPGHYPRTALPGMGRTIAIAGHRTTFLAPFKSIDRLRRGDQIRIRMPYGRFVYRVSRTRIVEPTDVWVTQDTGREQLVLTACHPLYSAAKRIVVFAALAAKEAVS